MISFAIGMLMWSIVLGIFLGLMFTTNINGRKRIFFVILIALIVGATVSAAFEIEYIGDDTQWNNGNCPDCNTEWELINVQHLRNSGEVYYWNCPQCGTIIKLHRQF